MVLKPLLLGMLIASVFALECSLEGANIKKGVKVCNDVSFCLKITSGDTVLMRGCSMRDDSGSRSGPRMVTAPLPSNEVCNQNGCLDKVEGGIVKKYCCCNTDLCNAPPGSSPPLKSPPGGSRPRPAMLELTTHYPSRSEGSSSALSSSGDASSKVQKGAQTSRSAIWTVIVMLVAMFGAPRLLLNY